MIEEKIIKELLRVTEAGFLFHREGQELELKEQFNFAGLADYLRDFAAFSNNKGGYLIFGVTNSPRRLTGLSITALEQFERIDPERISGSILECFSSNILWEQATFLIGELSFGVFKIYEAYNKPVIAKKDEGKDNIIKNGEIYYRYGGRTQKIQFAELESIINKRIKQNNDQWLDLMKKIGKAGVHNAAIFNTEESVIEKDDLKILVIDEDLAKKLKFIKEGEFVEKGGSETLKLVGDVVPIDRVEVIKKVKEHLLKEYPLSAIELANEVTKQLPKVSRNDVWKVIQENDVKNNSEYSAYNFRNKKQEDSYNDTRKVAAGTPSIYNQKAIDFIKNVLKNE